MKPSFTIKEVPGRRMFKHRLEGFWTEQTCRDYAAAAADAERRYASTGQVFCSLIDIADWPVQSKAVADWLSGPFASAQSANERIAFVTGGALVRMQAQRVAASVNARHFGSTEEAEAWLLEQLDGTA